MAERNNSTKRRWIRSCGLLALSTSMVVGSFASHVDAKPRAGKNKPVTEAPVAEPVAPPTLGSMYSVVDQIGARSLWERGITGAGINVALIDTGVADVAALSGPDKVIALVDLSAEAGVEEAKYMDNYGHGTHMAGIIAGRTPGSDPATAAQHPEWFMGVAPDASLVSVKVGDNSGAVDVSQVIAGIDWVVEYADELDISVLKLSFGSDSLHTYLTDPLTFAVERAWKAGIVVVVAAGNDGLGQARLGVPANDPFMISVGGIEATDSGQFVVPDWATNGNLVRNPDLAAPGSHIESLRAPGSRADLEYPSARVGEHLFLGSGSSQAAAVTSGAAALLLQQRPWLTPDQVKAKLTRGADDQVVPFASGIFTGEGALRVDVAAGESTLFSQQLHLPALGTGSLQESRGTSSMNVLGIPFLGETTVLGSEWLGTTWRGDRWSAGTWDGGQWTGNEWMGTTWRDASWTGAQWTGGQWNGTTWRAGSWDGTTWRSASWTGTTWRAGSWEGTTWRAGSWEGTTWRSSTWSSAGWS